MNTLTRTEARLISAMLDTMLTTECAWCETDDLAITIDSANLVRIIDKNTQVELHLGCTAIELIHRLDY